MILKLSSKVERESIGNVIEIESIYKSSKRLTYGVDLLDASQYDIKITRVSDYDESTRVANDIQIEFLYTFVEFVVILKFHFYQ